jgi:hypothetical protein
MIRSARTLPARIRSVSTDKRLLDVGVGRGPVDLVKIDMVGLQAAQRRLHRLHDPASRIALLVRILAHGPCTLVASTMLSRRPFSALPTISSDSPRLYLSAVSTKLMPKSKALWMMRMQSS